MNLVGNPTQAINQRTLRHCQCSIRYHFRVLVQRKQPHIQDQARALTTNSINHHFLFFKPFYLVGVQRLLFLSAPFDIRSIHFIHNMESALDKISSTSDGSSPKESCPENSDVKDMNDLSRKVSHKPNEKYGWKRNKKRRKQISREKVDWSKIEMSAVEKHSGYIDFSPWIISKQTTGPSGSPVKVDSFLPPVPDAQRIQLPLTEATHEYADNIPESVRQFERQMKKQRAEQRVARPVTIEDLRVVYIDKYIVVANKPAGRLTVPGLRGNPSLAQLIFDTFGCESGLVAKVVVHRLDMDTSGLVVFARTDDALSELHRSFRDMEVNRVKNLNILHN